MTNPKPLILPNSEYFLIARCVNRQGFPLEFGVNISYRPETPEHEAVKPMFRVENWRDGNGHEVDVQCSENADEMLSLYNAIVQGEQ